MYFLTLLAKLSGKRFFFCKRGLPLPNISANHMARILSTSYVHVHVHTRTVNVCAMLMISYVILKYAPYDWLKCNPRLQKKNRFRQVWPRNGRGTCRLFFFFSSDRKGVFKVKAREEWLSWRTVKRRRIITRRKAWYEDRRKLAVRWTGGRVWKKEEEKQGRGRSEWDADWVWFTYPISLTFTLSANSGWMTHVLDSHSNP